MRCAALIGISLGFAACFVGNAAEGYPCERDEDCGLELECNNGCCGNSCKFAEGSTSMAGSSGDSSSGSGSSESSTGSTTSSSSSSETGADLCGNGVVDGDEECDGPIQNGDDWPCRAGCIENTCGDEVLQTQGPGEEDCDEGDRNSAAPFARCSDECVAPLFYWDAGVESAGLWCDDDSCVAEGIKNKWGRTKSADAPWTTGAQQRNGGRQILVTAAFTIPNAARVSVSLTHAPNFEPCDLGPGDAYQDGGRVFLELLGEPGELMPLFPLPGDVDSGPLDCYATCGDVMSNQATNPSCPEILVPPYPLAFQSHDGQVEIQRVDLRNALGLPGGPLEARIVFEASYNCGFCMTMPNDPAWEIHRLVVAVTG